MSTKTMASVNPATGETLATFPCLESDEIAVRIGRAALGFAKNRARDFAGRAERLRRAASLLEERKEAYGRLMSLEMGKPIRSAIAEVQKCALVCRFYATHGEEFLRDESVPTDAKETFIRYEPLGVILAVMPWNFPFWQVFRFAAPALMAGNAALLKHASNVPQCAIAIEEILRDAGFADGEFQSLLVTAGQVPAIIADERVRATTLTGSEAAGASVASAAASSIKKSVLELGGSDPFIVLPSADLGDAVATGIRARIVNSGQSCIAAKRFIIHRAIAAAFTERFVAAMEALKVGDPLDENTDIGPLALPQIADELAAQVDESVRAGAKLLTGGRRLEGKGNFYAPTVLAEIPPDAPAYADETFGPVASIFVVDDADSALRIANATSFGLGSSVWTNDPVEADLFIDGIEAGQVFVNAMVASDPRVPFGGVKRSGFGRELGVAGIREFVNVKTVWIASLG